MQPSFSDGIAEALGRARVVCDDREPDEVVACLRRRDDVVVSVRRLAVGDYLVDERVVVERKTVADLAFSLADGRLFAQAVKLAERAPGRALLVLEGDGATLQEVSGVSRESIQGALVSLAVSYGLPILRARDAAETAHLLRCAALQVRRESRSSFHRPGYRPKRLRARQSFVLQGLPGIGPERALALLDAFGSVAAVFAASEDALADVPGIGPLTASRIHRVIHASVPPVLYTASEVVAP